eukprot:s136_g23.t1
MHDLAVYGQGRTHNSFQHNVLLVWSISQGRLSSTLRSTWVRPFKLSARSFRCHPILKLKKIPRVSSAVPLCAMRIASSAENQVTFLKLNPSLPVTFSFLFPDGTSQKGRSSKREEKSAGHKNCTFS